MKKILFLVAIILSLVTVVSGCGKKTEQNEVVPTVQNQTQKQQIAGEESEKKQPNALDYMAPGYNQAQNKIRQVQELRQQAIDENNDDIENVNY